ncbi:uncharacterized protein [Diadema setosum]|uniref:uncharacterized protein n=1 Tax=Diadema setosum TaxID=31175 RepID=UPI003B3AEF41
MSNNHDWENFDEEAERVVKSLMHGSTEQKLKTYEKMVHAIAVEYFGTKEKVKRVIQPNRRALRLRELREEKRRLQKRLRTAPDEEREGLKDLCDNLHVAILNLRKADRACKRRRERRVGRRNFMTDPFRAAKKILEPSPKIDLDCSRQELNNHLQQTYSSDASNAFEEWDGAIKPDPPSQPFRDTAPSFRELKVILGRTRNASAPGQNGLPYRMYKKCPRLLRVIWGLILTGILKRTVVNSLLQLRDSADETVQKMKPTIRCGRKWSPEEAVERAESRLHFEDIARGQVGRQGVGVSKSRPSLEKMSKKERRCEVGKIVAVEHDDEYFVRAVQMGVQGRWTSWENVKRRDLKWKTLFDMSPKLLQFVIGTTYDTVSTPKNLQRWGLAASETCALCGEECTTSHILAGCPLSLQQGRYTWRHNRVLRVILHGLQEEVSARSENPVSGSPSHIIRFVRQGETVTRSSERKHRGLLAAANDWKVKADLDSRLVFPEQIALTDLRPDIVIYSDERKLVAMVELTVCEEGNMQNAHERKARKYEELQACCEENGWSASVWPVEVGCRGFASHALLPSLYRLGARRSKAKALEKVACSVAEKASFHLWLFRHSQAWGIPHA